ncbi:acyltransferase [Lysinibacter sp. HNR]|uniref:acyltransferase family protein n=1 Tax=Lysinibacter sp. HNR TaxID=3031408 RepID=UPI002434A2BE|nr:acyltransferase [Lysinibacter sp. HNR]WGD36967.1 acyltransferase [Lysinibacter sp. HNR]
MTRTAPVSSSVSRDTQPLGNQARRTVDDTSPASGRDRAVDLARAACLLAVVGVHALMVGVSIPDGTAVLENALESWSGFTVFSWFAQMMPLFFVLGGFASATHYRRLRARGTSPTDYVATRLRRLLPVPLAAAGVTVTILCGLALSGADSQVVATAGWRISQPLWFLGVYILCSALVPLMLTLHERAPRRTLAVLACGVVFVDLLRSVTGIDTIGFVNLVFVWIAVQQLGFWLADGRTPGIRTAVFAVCGMVVLMVLGISPANLFDALNPPTGALALLGVVQFTAFGALRATLASRAEIPSVLRISDAINNRSLSVYSWHMPVIVLLAGLLLVAEHTLPIPLTAQWWITRPAWLLAVGIAVSVVVAATGRLENRPRTHENIRPAAPTAPAIPSTWLIGFSVVCSAGGVLLILAATGSLWAWISGAAMLACGLQATQKMQITRRNPAPLYGI